MTVYQCLNCRNYYGYDSRLKLKSFDPKTHTRYLDSDTWRCPHCNMRQDTRDIQPFMGSGGNRMLRQLTEEDIQIELLGNQGWIKRMFEKGYYDL